MKIRGYFDYDQPAIYEEDTRKVGSDGWEVPNDVWATYLAGQEATRTIERLYDEAWRAGSARPLRQKKRQG